MRIVKHERRPKMLGVVSISLAMVGCALGGLLAAACFGARSTSAYVRTPETSVHLTAVFCIEGAQQV